MLKLTKLYEIAHAREKQICITDGNKEYTWEDVIRITESYVVFLRRTYDKEQLRSACYLSKNSAELICWLAAFATLGISANGLDYSLPVETMTALIRTINPGLLLTSFKLFTAEQLNRLSGCGIPLIAIDAPTDPIISSIGELHKTELNTLLSSHSSAPFRAVSLTSGTSSIPKIALRYRSFDARRFAWFTQRFNFTHHDGFMLILPLYHAAGNGWARMFMGLGAPLYLVDQDDEQALASTLVNSLVKATVMTPNLVSRLTNLAHKINLMHHLRWVLVGGSYFPVKSKLAACAALGNIFNEYYGCTETGVNTLSDSQNMIAYPTSVGKVFDGNSVLILDENNIPLQTGIKGRVAMSSYMLMDEYGDGSKPFITLKGERYFIMADYGYLDGSGRLFLMNRNGESRCNHDLYSIEEDIRALPCVGDVALVSLQRKNKNQIGCIFSENKKNKTNFTLLMAKIEEKMGQAGVVDFTAQSVDNIPYSPSGKVRFSEVLRILDAA